MSKDIHALVEEHRAFYDVSPYYVICDQNDLDASPNVRRVQAGFDVDIYAMETDRDRLEMPDPYEYELGYTELLKIAEEISHHATDACSVEVIEFPSTAFFDPRVRNLEAMLRVRISHYRGLDQPAGAPEERALEELEAKLRSLGIKHR
jgi:hypothetical protein